MSFLAILAGAVGFVALIGCGFFIYDLRQLKKGTKWESMEDYD